MLNAYLTAISRGATFGDALKVFGDIDALDREVRAYSRPFDAGCDRDPLRKSRCRAD